MQIFLKIRTDSEFFLNFYSKITPIESYRTVLLEGIVDLQMARVDAAVERERRQLPRDIRHREHAGEMQHSAAERARDGLQRGDHEELLLLLANRRFAEGLLKGIL